MLRNPSENYELGAASLTEKQRAPAGGSVGDHPTDKDMWSRSRVISPPQPHRCAQEVHINAQANSCECVSVHLRREFVDSRA